MSANKLYFGNLAYQTREASLTSACEPYGTVVEAQVIMDKFSPNRSKGFGFVTMSTDEEAQKVIEALNGKDLDGRNVTVNVARPMEDRPPREPRSGGFRGGPRRDFGPRGGGSRGGDRW